MLLPVENESIEKREVQEEHFLSSRTEDYWRPEVPADSESVAVSFVEFNLKIDHKAIRLKIIFANCLLRSVTERP